MKRVYYFAVTALMLIMFPEAGYSQTANDSGASTQGAGRVKIIRDLRYAQQPGGVYAADTSSDRTLDLYLPADTRTTTVPVIVFVHGGGFAGGDKTGTRNVCEKLCEQGFAVASINYRLYLRHHKVSDASATVNMSKGLPARDKFNPALQTAIETASEDALHALKWVADHADHHKLDPSKLAIAGGSAGAMTALHTAYVNPAVHGEIKAVINLWGGLADESRIRSHSPPVLTYHGEQDKTISVEYAYALHKRMKETGSTQSRLFVLEGKGHAIYKYIASERCGEIAAFLNEVFK